MHPGGIIVPLQPSLQLQLHDVCQHFQFPTIDGLSLHTEVSPCRSLYDPRQKNHNASLPMITAAAWKSLFFSCGPDAGMFKPRAWTGPHRPSGLGVAARVEFQINYSQAAWFYEWLATITQQLIPSPCEKERPNDERKWESSDFSNPSLVSRSTSTDSNNSSSGRASLHSRASLPVRRSASLLQPRDDRASRIIRSRSIYLLAQERQYHSDDLTESQEIPNMITSNSCNKDHKDSDSFIPIASLSLHQSSQIKMNEVCPDSSIPDVPYDVFAHVPSPSKLMHTGLLNSAVEKSVPNQTCSKLIQENPISSTRQNSIEPQREQLHFNPSRDSMTSDIAKTVDCENPEEASFHSGRLISSGKTGDPESDHAKSNEPCFSSSQEITGAISKNSADDVLQGAKEVSHWSNLLTGMIPELSCSIMGWGSDGQNRAQSKWRHVPQRLSLPPEQSNSSLPVLSPAPNTSSQMNPETQSSFKKSDDLSLESAAIDQSEVSLAEPASSAEATSPASSSFVDLMSSPSILNLSNGSSRSSLKSPRMRDGLFLSGASALKKLVSEGHIGGKSPHPFSPTDNKAQPKNSLNLRRSESRGSWLTGSNRNSTTGSQKGITFTGCLPIFSEPKFPSCQITILKAKKVEILSHSISHLTTLKLKPKAKRPSNTGPLRSF